MSIINFHDPTVIQMNLDDNGKEVSLPRVNETKQVVDGKIPLEGLPDEQYRVQITGYVEINIKDKIDSPENFKCDYTHGILYFDQSKNGTSININKYYSRGQFYMPASRVWTKLSVDGEVTQTMDGAFDILDNQSKTMKRIEDRDVIIRNSDLDDYVEDVVHLDANLFGGHKVTHFATKEDIANLVTNKVEKISGKQLSDENYTIEEKDKLFEIEDGANKYIHPSGTNPHNTTKSDVGLENVDNTSDIDKPVSNGQKAALDLKVDKQSIANNLTTSAIGGVLDARQGKVINESMDVIRSDMIVRKKDSPLREIPDIIY